MLKVFLEEKKITKRKRTMKTGTQQLNYSFEQLFIIPLNKMVLYITYCWSFNLYGLLENRRINFSMSIPALSSFKVFLFVCLINPKHHTLWDDTSSGSWTFLAFGNSGSRVPDLELKENFLWLAFCREKNSSELEPKQKKISMCDQIMNKGIITHAFCPCWAGVILRQWDGKINVTAKCSNKIPFRKVNDLPCLPFLSYRKI